MVSFLFYYGSHILNILEMKWYLFGKGVSMESCFQGTQVLCPNRIIRITRWSTWTNLEPGDAPLSKEWTVGQRMVTHAAQLLIKSGYQWGPTRKVASYHLYAYHSTIDSETVALTTVLIHVTVEPPVFRWGHSRKQTLKMTETPVLVLVIIHCTSHFVCS